MDPQSCLRYEEHAMLTLGVKTVYLGRYVRIHEAGGWESG